MLLSPVKFQTDVKKKPEIGSLPTFKQASGYIKRFQLKVKKGASTWAWGCQWSDRRRLWSEVLVSFVSTEPRVRRPDHDPGPRWSSWAQPSWRKKAAPLSFPEQIRSKSSGFWIRRANALESAQVKCRKIRFFGLLNRVFCTSNGIFCNSYRFLWHFKSIFLQFKILVFPFEKNFAFLTVFGSDDNFWTDFVIRCPFFVQKGPKTSK